MKFFRHSGGRPPARPSAVRRPPSPVHRPPSAFHRPRRRGVLLLIILGMLAMFGLVAITFVITTGHFRRSSQALHRVDQYRDDPKALLDEAFAQCVRGTNNVGSVIGPHSLLENLYGNDARLSYINTGSASFPVNGSGQLFRFQAYDTKTPGTVTPAFPMPAPWLWTSNPPMHAAKYAEQCAGSVITFYNGRCAGMSARIVAVLQNTTNANSRDFVVQTTGEMMTLLQQDAAEKTTIYYLINGMPFSGTGRGFNVSTTTASYQGLNATYPTSPTSPTPATPTGLGGKPYALLPNPAYFPRTSAEAGYYKYYPDPAGPGGANPDYNAPDYQNMLLAMVRPPQNGDAVPVPIPSLLRPELAYYWSKADTTNWPAATMYGSNPSAHGSPLGCMAVLRPMQADHTLPVGNQAGTDPQAFTGSNPNFNVYWDGKLTNSTTGPGQWDVDNDGDGIPDSIWVDLGLPARAGPDGKMYKPLFAILCTDLDGRLNLNAHGSLAQTFPTYYQAGPTPTTFATGAYYAGGAAGTATGFSIPRGQGFGPAEINLNPLFGNGAPSTSGPYASLLSGSSPLEGRYGEGAAASAGPFQSGVRNPVWQNKNFCLFTSSTAAYGYYNRMTAAGVTSQYLGVYGTPPDPYGTFVAALDVVGRPIYGYTANSGTGQNWLNFWGSAGGTTAPNTPYEMNLARESAWRHISGGTPPTTIDNPFTPAELERMLRPYDVDTSGLVGDSSTATTTTVRSSRIVSLTKATFGAASPALSLDGLREMATTESYDVPCPSPALPREFLNPSPSPKVLSTVPAGPAAHFVDLIFDLLGDATHSSVNMASLIDFFPRELLSGRRMDLNRPFGNGAALPVGTTAVVDLPNAVGGGVPVLNVTQYTYTSSNHQFNTSSTTLPFDWSNRRTATSPGATDNAFGSAYDTPRARYARDLYLLAMLFAQTSGYYDPSWLYLYPTIASGQTAWTALTAQQQQYLRARALAQWAVNVVSFRDRTSIMTCFVYDPDPFNTVTGPIKLQWRPTGNPSAAVAGSYAGATFTAGTDKIATPHVVWGCQFPSLLITETLATHDRRTQDTAGETNESSSNPPRPAANTTVATNPDYVHGKVLDPDFDQVTRPQGSLFVELYNPSNPYDAPATELETYDAMSKSWSVNLTKTTPAGDPVWRLLIVAPISTKYGGPLPNAGKSPLNILPGGETKTAPFYFTPDPDDPIQMSALASVYQAVRYAYFVNPGAVRDETQYAANPPLRYYPNTTTMNNFPVIPPGRYAVIGPGQPPATGAAPDSITCLGFTASTYPIDATKVAPTTGATTSSRRIELIPQASTAARQVAVYSNGTANDFTTGKFATAGLLPLAFVIDNALPAVNAANTPPRLSVSEPFAGYPVCHGNQNTPVEYYKAGTDTIYDTPLDNVLFVGNTLATDTFHHNVWNSCLRSTGTYPFFGIVYLQRLADPTHAWDVAANPYRTIDSMQIDLTCFNGIWTPTAPGNLDPNDGSGVSLASVYLNTRERGRYFFDQARSQTNSALLGNIWPHEPEMMSSYGNSYYPQAPYTGAVTFVTGWQAPAGPTAASGNYFNVSFAHSLGYLNQAFGLPRGATGATAPGGAGSIYLGAPQVPFPSLAWNHRPFASPLELLMVPQCSSSQLLAANYFPGATADPVCSTFRLASSTTYNPFATYASANNTHAFGYLANLFNVGGAFSAAGPASPLVRLLDYVEVPSPFVSARNQLDPQTFSNSSTLADLPFAVPFNWVSNYRDPGKINLNTIASPQVWQGLINYFPDITFNAGVSGSNVCGASSAVTGSPTGSAPTGASSLLWGKFIQSRRGYQGSTSNSVLDFGVDPSTKLPFPTRFANPFRGSAGAWLVPPVPTSSTLSGGGTPNILATAISGEVNTGLLRTELASSNRPLFQFDTSTTYSSSANKVSGATNGLIDATHPLNPDRNPCFRYQLIEKLSNTTTTRSNVYAVWITVGYFEARPGPVTQFHPDGYYLGQELGTDTGDIHRHRAFYIFDRSVPMGFVRGQDLNFDKGILIKRFIE